MKVYLPSRGILASNDIAKDADDIAKDAIEKIKNVFKEIFKGIDPPTQNIFLEKLNVDNEGLLTYTLEGDFDFDYVDIYKIHHFFQSMYEIILDEGAIRELLTVNDLLIKVIGCLTK